MPAHPLHGFVDDASTLYAGPPVPSTDPLVGSVLVRDVDLPAALGSAGPIRVVSTGGAGSLAGPLRLAARAGVRLTGLVTALRDLDGPAGNARRVVAALDAAADEGLPVPDVAVEVPTERGYAATLDVLAERELTLALRLPAGVTAEAVAGWVDAALDRETSYVVTGGLGRAVTGADGPGYLSLLVATGLAWDGASGAEVAAALASPVVPEDVAGLTSARRWFRSFATSSVTDVRTELVALGLA